VGVHGSYASGRRRFFSSCYLLAASLVSTRPAASATWLSLPVILSSWPSQRSAAPPPPPLGVPRPLVLATKMMLLGEQEICCCDCSSKFSHIFALRCLRKYKNLPCQKVLIVYIYRLNFSTKMLNQLVKSGTGMISFTICLCWTDYI
jgi:hypothetical protein